MLGLSNFLSFQRAKSDYKVLSSDSVFDSMMASVTAKLLKTVFICSAYELCPENCIFQTGFPTVVIH